MSGNHRMRILATHRQTTAIQMPRTGRKRLLRRAMVNRQIHRNLWNADGTHHAIASIQQTLVFRVFGASGILVTIASGVCARRAGTGTVAGVGLIVVVQLGERILSLANHRLPRFGETLVVRPSCGECLVGLRIRPARDALLGTGGRARQLLRGLVLQHFREKTNADCGENQHRRKHTQGNGSTHVGATLANLFGHIGRLGERRRNVGARVARGVVRTARAVVAIVRIAIKIVGA